jgi:hypothetical protein
MAKDTNRQDTTAAELRGILRGYGLNPNLFDGIIHQAVVNQWSPEQFIAELYASDEFATAFPGIYNPDGSLKLSPAEYLQLAYGMGGYVDIARNYGLKLSREHIGLLVQNNVSPDEWARRAEILQQARTTEAYRVEFNKLLQAQGHEPLGRKEWFDFIASRSQARIEDLYQAAALRMSDLELTREEALQAAREIGREQPASPVDISEIVAQARRLRDEIGPELQAAGITDADLAVLSAGSDPRGLAPKLEQILRNRRALVQAGSRSAGTGFTSTPEGL